MVACRVKFNLKIERNTLKKRTCPNKIREFQVVIKNGLYSLWNDKNNIENTKSKLVTN